MRGIAAAFVFVIGAFLAPTSPASSAVQPGDCGWPIKADPDRINIAFPDEGAQYWLTNIPLVPGVDVVITGTFPRARYMSFHAYEGSMPIDIVSDVDVVPKTGINPFVPHAKRDDAGTYEVRVVGGPRPPAAEREPNTLYAGEGLNGEPLVETRVIYRVYLPEIDVRGGVGLPRIEYRGAPDVASPLPSCEGFLPVGDVGVNDAIKEASWPRDTTASPSERTWGISRSRPQPNTIGPLTVYTGNVFFANFDNDYLSLFVGRHVGDVAVMRAKAPTFPDTRGAKRMGTGQLRYWSFCTNELATTRYVACLADEDAVLDANGYVTVVVSDVAHKPSNLRATDNWLPAGPYPDSLVLYRHMRPDPTFTQSVQSAPSEAEAPASMGEYYPNAIACSRAQFELDRCGSP